jgi:sterol desaturase/sphingolipid hydroxylase (fatty acid hydroxylase superfamily)
VNDRVFVLFMLVLNGLVLLAIERGAASTLRPRERSRGFTPNLLLTALLLVVNLALDRGASALGVASPPDGAGLVGRFGAPAWAEVVAVVIVLDGLAYLAHVLMHKLGAAWRFHRVHHSDTHVDVTTAFRQHPLETVWRYSFLFAGVLLLGASSRSVAVYLALSALNAQLEHARISLPAPVERLLRVVIATPAMHRVHHSRTACETDTNYSNILSFWDRLFGTYRAPRPGEVVACGLDDLDAPDRQRTPGLLALPFIP